MFRHRRFPAPELIDSRFLTFSTRRYVGLSLSSLPLMRSIMLKYIPLLFPTSPRCFPATEAGCRDTVSMERTGYLPRSWATPGVWERRQGFTLSVTTGKTAWSGKGRMPEPLRQASRRKHSFGVSLRIRPLLPSVPICPEQSSVCEHPFPTRPLLVGLSG